MMSVKNLRDSILQMAVEGKLVEQREEEGTAADLLASIREQRAQLVREKKAKPVKGGESVIWRDDDGHWFERRGKGKAVCIDDEIPFDIPDSWCWARFASCSINLDYKRIPISKKERQSLEKVYPYYGATGEIDKVDRYIFDDELLLIGEDGANLISKSRPLAFIVKGKYWVNNHAHCVDAVLKPMLPWLSLSINSKDISAIVRGTAQPKFNQSMLDSILVSIPPLEEQYRIASRLAELAPFIDEFGRAHVQREALDRELPIKLRKSILQAAVEGKLTEQSDGDEPASLLLAGIREKRAQLVREGKAKPVKGGESIIYRDDTGHWIERHGKSDPVCIDEEIPFDIPDSWSWARLGDLIDLKSGIDLDKKLYSDTEKIGIPYITGASNLQNGHVLENRWTDSPKRKSIKGDLLLTCKGTIGEMAYNPFPVAHIARQIMAIKAIDDKMLGYIRLFLLFYVDKVKKAAKGIIPGIERADLTEALIPIPALAEQCHIVEKVDAALQQANTHL